jgi:hypothetical protein
VEQALELFIFDHNAVYGNEGWCPKANGIIRNAHGRQASGFDKVVPQLSMTCGCSKSNPNPCIIVDQVPAKSQD